MRIRTLPRPVLATATLVAVAGLLTACGAESDPETTAPGGADSASWTPVTVEHKYGSTEITEEPQRVVAVGLLEQDALLALGVVPVGVTKWFGEAEGAIFPWAEDALTELDGELPVVLEDTDGINVEDVAALRPDLIVGLYSAMTQEEYDQLSQLAPVVAGQNEVDFTDPWDQITETVGLAVGKGPEAEALVDDVQAQIEAAAEAHPEFEGAEAAVVTNYEGLYVYGEEDPRGQILSQLGFEFPEVIDQPDAEEFGWSLSAERTSDLSDLDAVVWLGYDIAEPGLVTLFENTTAYEQGRWFSIGDPDGAYYVAQSMVTPLSIPYVLERYVPQLAAAVDGDPSTEPVSPQP